MSAMYWQNWAACRSTLRCGSRLGGCPIRDRVSGPAPGDGFRVSGIPDRRGGAPSGGMDSCLCRKDGWRGVGGERDVLAELGRLSLDPSTRLPPRRMFHPRQGERPRARRWIPGLGDTGSAGGCAFRRDGFLPPQERRMEGGGGGVGETAAGIRSGSVSRSRPLYERLPCSLHHRACSTAPCRGRTACSRAGPV